MNKKNIILIITVMLAVATASAQTVTNVTAEQVNKTIHVSYDIDKLADITLFVSTDGGSTYIQLYRVSGDVGKNVSAGHKTIVWDVLAEWERLVGENIMFKVRSVSKIKAQEQEDLTFTVNGVTFKMVYVEGGTFTMGCTSEQAEDCSIYEKPAHSVTVSDFYMGETEVTQALWQAVMGSNPSRIKGDNLPMDDVSWNDCQKFIVKLNAQTGKTFRLPTEAEWEYAARGGNKSGGYKYSGSDNIEEVAWYWRNSGKKYMKGRREMFWQKWKSMKKNNCQAHPVRQKKANELGLYDMSGNVDEWCSDWYGYYGGSSQTNPVGPSSGSDRVLRGGSWDDLVTECRVSYRGSAGPVFYGFGFRLSLAR